MHGPPLMPVHMHSLTGLIDLYNPICSSWHELYPEYCEEWHLSSWDDNGNGYLDTCDVIDLTDVDTEK